MKDYSSIEFNLLDYAGFLNDVLLRKHGSENSVYAFMEGFYVGKIHCCLYVLEIDVPKYTTSEELLEFIANKFKHCFYEWENNVFFMGGRVERLG